MRTRCTLLTTLLAVTLGAPTASAHHSVRHVSPSAVCPGQPFSVYGNFPEPHRDLRLSIRQAGSPEILVRHTALKTTVDAQRIDATLPPAGPAPHRSPPPGAYNVVVRYDGADPEGQQIYIVVCPDAPSQETPTVVMGSDKEVTSRSAPAPPPTVVMGSDKELASLSAPDSPPTVVMGSEKALISSATARLYDVKVELVGFHVGNTCDPQSDRNGDWDLTLGARAGSVSKTRQYRPGSDCRRGTIAVRRGRNRTFDDFRLRLKGIPGNQPVALSLTGVDWDGSGNACTSDTVVSTEDLSVGTPESWPGGRTTLTVRELEPTGRLSCPTNSMTNVRFRVTASPSR